MRKFFIAVILMFTITNSCFAFTDVEIVSKVRRIFELKNSIESLRAERTVAEQLIVDSYKVAQCNADRNASALSYQSKIDVLLVEIESINSDLATI